MARGSQNAAVCASALAVICIVLWAILLAFPYWPYPHALHTAFTAILLPCCLLLPIVFFFGYGARSGEAQALHEVAREANVRIQALNRDPRDLLGTGSGGSDHQQSRPAGSNAVPSHAPHVEARLRSWTGQSPQHHSRDDEKSQAAGSFTSSTPLTYPGTHSGFEAKPGPLYELNCPAGDHLSASSADTRQPGHAEDQEGTWAGLSRQPREQHGRQATSTAAQPHAPMDQNSSAAEHITFVAPPLMGNHCNGIQPSSNGRQETAPLMGTNQAHANGDSYQQQLEFTDAEQETMIQQKQHPVLSNDGLPTGAGTKQAPGFQSSSGTDGDVNGLYDGPFADRRGVKNPPPSDTIDRLRMDADDEVKQLSHNRFGQPTKIPAANPTPSLDETASPQPGTETTVPQDVEDPHKPQMQVDVPARPCSPFHRLRLEALEALTEGPSDGAPEPFPNADTFRSNREDRHPLQADTDDHLTLARQQQDSFSFPELLDGAPIRRRSPAVSLEPTRAAAGAFGSSVLNYDHQLQQRPGPLTGPSPAIVPEPPSIPSSASNAQPHINDNGNFTVVAGTRDTQDNSSGSAFPLSITTRPALAGMDGQAQHGFRDLAGGASGHASPVSTAPTLPEALHALSPETDTLLGSSPLPVKPYGRLRSGRLGEEGDGSNGSAASSPVYSQSTGSPRKAAVSDQDAGHMHADVIPVRSSSPLGVVRAGRLGE